MDRELPKLPLGLSDFANIRESGANYLYVDKTRLVADMLNSGKYLFLSRPRRFGKSLLCSTIQYLYQGRRDLFQGLAIEPLWDWTHINPVVHFSLAQIGSTSPEKLDTNLRKLIRDEAGKFKLDLDEDDAPMAMVLLLRKIRAKTGRRVVLIIDEYEKPVHDHIGDPTLAKKLRDVLAAFYGALKGCDTDIEKLFVTGVGRMVKTSIFSGFNQMLDLTLDQVTATVCGYTQGELEACFAPFIGPLAKANNLTVDQAWQTLRERYNGYWWSKGERVYNPWAILNCVRAREFSNFWWSSGTPSGLVKLAPYLKIPDSIDPIESSDLSLQFDLENIKAEPLLWQAGYLTIKKANRRTFILGFPNAEVREAWNGMLLDRFCGNHNAPAGQTSAAGLLESLEEGDRNRFEKLLSSLFASIPYPLHLPKESFYHAVFLAALQAVGGQLIAEAATSQGRADAVLKTHSYIYIIEFKLGSAAEALKQIRRKKYYQSFLADPRQIVLLGAGGFGDNAIQCLWENIG